MVSTDEADLTTVTPSHGRLAGSLHPASASTALAVTTSTPPPMKPKRRVSRVKPPKDSRVAKAVTAAIAMRAQGMRPDDIAAELGLTKETIRTYIKRAHRKGWINHNSFDDPEDRLEYVLKDKVVDNLNTVLGEREDDGSLSSRAVNVSLEVAKGTGLLKQHQVVKGEGGNPLGFALKVQVEMPVLPPGHSVPALRTDHIGGQPYFDAEVVEGTVEEK